MDFDCVGEEVRSYTSVTPLQRRKCQKCLQIRFRRLSGKRGVRSAECGVRSVENAECRKCGV